MAILTTSQLTFYDYKDIYHVELSADYIVVSCDKNNIIQEDTIVDISYGVYCGSTRVSGTAVIDKIDLFEDLSIEDCTSTSDGRIKFTIKSSADVSNIDTLHVEFLELYDDGVDTFKFDKYITFVKNVAGEVGRGVKKVEEYYFANNNGDVAPDLSAEWKPTAPAIDNINKYLWNYEKIIYTDNNFDTTPPAVIGIYGEGRGIEKVINYYLTTSENSGITHDNSDWKPEIKNPDATNKYLWNYEEIIYTDHKEPTKTEPVIIGVFSSDGRGIKEVKEWYQVSDNTSVPPTEWDTIVPEMTEENQFLWNYEEIKYTDGESEKTKPAVIGVYGSQGRGITSVVNYYLATPKQNDVKRKDQEGGEEEDWQTSPQPIDATKKYLWNYEQINYSSGDPDYTDPVIIGVFSSDGASAFVFEVYSQDGLVFKEDLDEIELQTIAYDGASAVNGDSYKWYYVESGEDIEIPDATSSSLTVNKNDVWAKKTIKCVMTYGDKPYEDYISLVDQVVIYTSEIKYFHGSNVLDNPYANNNSDGSNVFTHSDKHIIAYMALYKNGEEIDLLPTSQYANAQEITDDDIIITDVKKEDESSYGEEDSGKLIYFVVKDPQIVTNYNLVLGEFDGAFWRVVDTKDVISKPYECVYSNSKAYNNLSKSSLYNESNKLMIISKGQINKTLAIGFDAYKSVDNTKLVSSVRGNVIDTNDPIIKPGPDGPENPVDGMLWIDIASSPYVIKVCQINEDGTAKWVDANQQFDGKVYTSQPTSYSVLDVWILNDTETCSYFDENNVYYEYGPGSMLRASMSRSEDDGFVASDWSEIQSKLTEMRDNVAQYFEFNADTGLKISQGDQKFYVQIDAREMGFYDNTKGQHEKVVSIGERSAKIRHLTIEDQTSFNCNSQADFNSQININNPYSSTTDTFGFAWQIETDGSLSLVVIS